MAKNNLNHPAGSMLRSSLMIILGAIWLFFSCGDGKKTEWTLLFYFDGDNGLAESALQDLEELEKAGANPDVRLIAEVDLPHSANLLFYKTKRLEIAHDDDPGLLSSVVIEDLGEQDMADPRTLSDFINWGKKNYPARRYALFLWDHGDAWYQESITSQASRLIPDGFSGFQAFPPSRLPAFEPEAIFDDEDNASGPMRNYQLREALESAGVDFDLIVFDACIMATVEVAYELKDRAGILVASQELVQENGLPYEAILARLNGNPLMPAEELAGAIVESYQVYCEETYTQENPFRNQTLSAIRLGDDLANLAGLVDQAAGYLLASLPAGAGMIASARAEAEEFDRLLKPGFYTDVFDLFSRVGLPAALWTPFSEALSRTVISEYHGLQHPGAHGLSIVFPQTPDAASNYDPTYSDYDALTGTGSPSLFMELSWDNFLSEYYLVKYPDITF